MASWRLLSSAAFAVAASVAHPAWGQSGLRRPSQPTVIVVSFDGAGDLMLWSRWRAVAKQVDARMTFFLSGPYLYPGNRRSDYTPPYKKPGASDIGWGDTAGILGRTKVLREAIAEGHEIGTHANGHFCGTNGIGRWTTAQWTAELGAFDRMVRTGPSHPCKHGRSTATKPR